MNFFLYVRLNGYTQIMKVEKENIMDMFKKNMDKDFEIGVFMGSSFNKVIKVYTEYAPFRRVELIKELNY